jgi:hypothetical protein
MSAGHTAHSIGDGQEIDRACLARRLLLGTDQDGILVPWTALATVCL